MASRMAELERLLAAEPDDAFLNFALAMELAKIGRIEEAVARFERAIELDADYCAAYYQKAKALLQANQTDQARRAIADGIAVAQRTGDNHTAEKLREMLQTLGVG